MAYGVTIISQRTRRISPKLGTNLQVHILHKAPPEIIQVHQNALELLLNKLHLTLMNNFAMKKRVNVQVRRECDHTQTVIEKMLICIDANETSLQLSPPTAPYGSNRTDPTTQVIAVWKALSATRRIFSATVTSHSSFSALYNPTLRIFRGLQRSKLVR